jgi:hypothetical protein
MVIVHNYLGQGAVAAAKPCEDSRSRTLVRTTGAGNKISPDASHVPTEASLCRIPSKTRVFAHVRHDPQGRGACNMGQQARECRV